MWLLLIFLGARVWSAPLVLEQAPSASSIEYQAVLRASPDLISPSQEYRVRHPSASLRERLLALFADAQKAFLGPSPEQARAAFAAVMAMAAQEDWSGSEREVLGYAALRLAQLESESSTQNALWLDKALFFNVKADATLFPPPLLAELETRRRQSAPLHAGAALDPEWTLVLVDGVPCARLDCPTFINPHVPVRVTFLSDKWRPQVMLIRLEDLSQTHPPRQPLVSGSCARPVASAPRHRAFFDLECQSRANLDLQPHPADSRIFAVRPEEAPTPSRHKWLWIGGGGLALATVIAIVANANRGHSSGPQPTSGYGY